MKSWFRHTWPYAVAVSACVSGVCYVAMGATYNFYFNNTEQGPNSTATPTVTVHSDGTVDGAKNVGMPGQPPGTYPAQEAGAPPQGAQAVPQTASAVYAPPAPPQAAPQAIPQTATTVYQEEEAPKPKKKHWRLALDVLDTHETVTSSNWNNVGGGEFYSTSSSTESVPGMAVELGLRLGRFFTINSFVGGQLNQSTNYYGDHEDPTFFGGLELELTPIRLSLFNAEDFLELGVLAGASTLGATSDNVATFHYGARLAMNFSPTFGLVATLRTNDAYTMGSAGLAFSF